jgi:hypothetical protein
MQCLKCNAPLEKDAAFCGNCGFQLGNNPSLLSQRQAPGFYSAPTVAAGLDVQAAMIALENPYHALFPNDLNVQPSMSNLILNDNSKRVWSERREVEGRAWYGSKGVFHLRGEQIEAKAQHKSPIRDFTLQAVVEFHQEQTVQNTLSIACHRPDCLWSVLLTAGDKSVWLLVNGSHELNLRHSSYEPFLLGVVREKYRVHVFVNLEYLASIGDNEETEEGLLKLYVHMGNVTVSHTRLWVP